MCLGPSPVCEAPIANYRQASLSSTLPKEALQLNLHAESRVVL